MDELSGVDEKARADALGESVLLEVAHLLAQLGEVHGHGFADARFMADDAGLKVARRVVKLDGHEALARAVLEVFERALVAGVVGDDEEEAVPGLDYLAQLLDRQQAPVIGKRVNEDGGVLAGFDDLVEIADGAGLDRSGQWAVDPAGRVVFEQVAPDKVGCREVLVAGDGDELAAFVGTGAVSVTFADDGHWPAQLVGHVLNEAGLAATSGPLEEDGELL